MYDNRYAKTNKSLEQSHPGSTDEMSPYCIGKLNDSPSFSDYVDDEQNDRGDHQFAGSETTIRRFRGNTMSIFYISKNKC